MSSTSGNDPAARVVVSVDASLDAPDAAALAPCAASTPGAAVVVFALKSAGILTGLAATRWQVQHVTSRRRAKLSVSIANIIFIIPRARCCVGLLSLSNRSASWQ